MKNAFCILAAGMGMRARNLGNLHKALLPLQNTTVLTHIIEKCPPDTQIVIAVGYQGEIIKNYCRACHPEMDIIFVNVDNFDAPGSGPGYSLKCCEAHLQRPFYLCCADCLVSEELPKLDFNWLGVQRVDDPENWSTANVVDGRVTDFMNKSSQGFGSAWIGIAGIKDYAIFWSKLGPSKEKEFEVVSAFYTPLDYGIMLAYRFTWFDTGTSENYRSSVRSITGQRLGMAKVIDETTCHYAGQCIKIFGNNDLCEGRILRAKLLDGLVPPLTFEGQHVYAYKWVEGDTLYTHQRLEVFTKFLDWCEANLWAHHPSTDFEESCMEFYHKKTARRTRDYLHKKGLQDDVTDMVINGRKCEPIDAYLCRINWTELCEGIPSRFHGDLQPENVIVDNDGGFHLIDWRDSFAGLPFGDQYYDLAKLNGGLSMCYESIKSNSFWMGTIGNQAVNYQILLPGHLNEWRHYYESWLARKGFDLYKVRLLTALVYLNMAPLHVEPVDDLLFNHAKYMLSMLPA